MPYLHEVPWLRSSTGTIVLLPVSTRFIRLLMHELEPLCGSRDMLWCDNGQTQAVYSCKRCVVDLVLCNADVVSITNGFTASARQSQTACEPTWRSRSSSAGARSMPAGTCSQRWRACTRRSGTPRLAHTFTLTRARARVLGRSRACWARAICLKHFMQGRICWSLKPLSQLPRLLAALAQMCNN